MFQGGSERGRASQAEGIACSEAQRLQGVYLRNGNTGRWVYAENNRFWGREPETVLVKCIARCQEVVLEKPALSYYLSALVIFLIIR